MDSVIRLMIVDDSAFMRQVISRIAERDKRILIVGRARNGEEALEKIPLIKPHVITLDVEMPVMGGLEALERIMELYPVPVIMLSSLTAKGAQVTLQALELGAVDFLLKPTEREQLNNMASELLAKIRIAATVPVAAKKFPIPIKPTRSTPYHIPQMTPGTIEAVVIGTSTGGPSALQKVVPRLPQKIPAGIVIVQHMPKGFTRILADRLNQNSLIEVKEAEHGDCVGPGLALVAPAGKQMYLDRSPKGVIVSLKDEASVTTLFKPSVDVTMLSAAEAYGKNLLGVIMTGMGNDGLRGFRRIKELGGKTLAEAEETCVVFGMPKAVINAGLADEIHPVDDLAARITHVVGKEK